ncbi:type II toxin-antitoxin system VapC family toxin [Cellulomonas sp. ACRRI]|uniref:type II toxin-antitoxin system VapC family toxin n=1 Tax=Cellulomonas sp. ACRRI TaxID=2918188 RepID=UPI001EF3A3B9|nr:type II toxin-antitoxin system VapC family toxin [Cellulomonas sp. ACRRI]MCG7284572.1 type II toxin-antitoxin system VapC family toxin [Cellulomonas sp. ACRRI]
MTTYYLDSSVALRAVLAVPERPDVLAWIDAHAGRLVSSRLLRTEVVRVLRREQLPVSSASPLLSRVGLISLSDEVASVAESIERHVKTLDALHLATALVIGDPVVVATHDAGMAAVAAHLGLDVEDPVL